MVSKWYKSGVTQFKSGKQCIPPWAARQSDRGDAEWRQGYADAANGKVKS